MSEHDILPSVELDGAEKESGLPPPLPLKPNTNLATVKNRRSAWINAISDDNGLELARDLIRKGANVNEPLFYKYNYSGHYERLWFSKCQRDYVMRVGTPLLFALYENNLNVAEALINSGANVNAADDCGFSPLHHSADRGWITITRLLIEKDVNVNATDRWGSTSLHVALLYDWPDIHEALIRAGAAVNTSDVDGSTPLHVASGSGRDVKIIKLLIKKGADANTTDDRSSTPLHKAVWARNKEIVETLLHAGADVNAANDEGYTPLHISLLERSGLAETLINADADVNAPDEDGFTPLHFSVKNDYRIACQLIEKGANVNAANRGGYTPLHHFCDMEPNPGYYDMCTKIDRFAACMVFFLIDSGADVKGRDEFGSTPLHILSKIHCPKLVDDSLSVIVQTLIDKGADVKQVDNEGRNALHNASCGLFPEMVAILLKHGVSVNAVTNRKDTALHCATKPIRDYETSKTAAIIEMLLGSGADITAVNSEGRTPLDNAKLHFKEIVPFMLSSK